MPPLTSLILLAVPAVLVVWMAVVRRSEQVTFERFQSELAVGQEVVTTSGLLGRIVALDDDPAHLQVADGVVLRFDRRAIGARGVPGFTPTEQE